MTRYSKLARIQVPSLPTGVQLTGRLEGSTADKEAVNVGLLAEFTAVLLVDAAAVEDSGLLGNLVADVGLEPLSDGLVDLLGLLGGGDLAGADGPDGLVGDDNLGPVRDLGLEGGELLADDLDGLAGLALLQGLAAAPDDAQAVLGCVLGLAGDHLVALAEDGAALGVAQDGPVDAAVLELRDGDFAGEGAVGLVVDVLGGDLNAGAEAFADEEEIQVGGRDDNLWSELSNAVSIDRGCTVMDSLRSKGGLKRTDVGVEFGLVQVVDNLLDGRDGPVPRRRDSS